MREPITISPEDRICGPCPMRSHKKLAKGVSMVIAAEEADRPIGSARTELGVAVNGCRKARLDGDCENVELIETSYSSEHPKPVDELQDPMVDDEDLYCGNVEEIDAFEAAGELATQLGYH